MSISLKTKLYWCWSSQILVPHFTAVHLNEVTPWKVPRAGKGTLHSIFTNGTCVTPFSYLRLGGPWQYKILCQSWFQEGRLALRPKSSRSWCFWWWRCLLYMLALCEQTLNYLAESGRCWCAQTCTTDYFSSNLCESSFTTVCMWT